MGSPWSPASSGADLLHLHERMLDAIARPYLRKEDAHDVRRQKRFVVCLWYSLIAVIVVVSATRYAMPDMLHDHSLLQSQMAEALWGWAFVNMIFNLVYLYVFGLTPFLKVFFIASMFITWTWAAVIDKDSGWHSVYVIVLDLCLMMESDRDEAILYKLSVLLRIASVVYVFLHVMAMSGYGPDIHPFDPPYNVTISFIVGAMPILFNFSLVRIYASNAQSHAHHIEESVDVASRIANHLANFDLDAAEEMLGDRAHECAIREPLQHLLTNLRSYRPFLPQALFAQLHHKETHPHAEPPNEAMDSLMHGQTTSWEHARNAVQRLRDPDYTLKMFHHDVESAFPELALYAAEPSDASPGMSSGRTGVEELQRTMGAMYSVYCLARLDMDGKEIFSYGVDEDWKPLACPTGEKADKRRAFHDHTDWDSLSDLMQRAGLIKASTSRHTRARSITRAITGTVRDVSSLGHSSHKVDGDRGTASANSSGSGSKGMRGSGRPWQWRRGRSGGKLTGNSGQLQVNEDRMMAMLVLTAIHDIMKNTNLLPVVQKQHAPYHGHATGERINDHDIALAYVMENFAGVLPSFHGLEPGQRAALLFTQGKMGFNNGHLVQGEAPPGPLLSAFKRVVVEGGASESDINFYFVHWITDLAGAVPFGSSPWPGSEKFATMFPSKVLAAFLESFSFLDHLAIKSEVEVVEEYLEERWHALSLETEDVTRGGRPAAMRVALMAQGFESAAVRAMGQLPPHDLDTLCMEMARTGRRQQFQSAPERLKEEPTGPAVLVYYSPALVQRGGPKQAVDALRVLAAVYRSAREIFPAETRASMVDASVTVRVEALKDLAPSDACSREWHVLQTSETEAEVVAGPAPETDNNNDRVKGMQAAPLQLGAFGPDRTTSRLPQQVLQKGLELGSLEPSTSQPTSSTPRRRQWRQPSSRLSGDSSDQPQAKPDAVRLPASGVVGDLENDETARGSSEAAGPEVQQASEPPWRKGAGR